MLIIVICSLMEKKYLSLKPAKSINFPTQSLDGNVYDFSVDCTFIDKSDILNIYKYLMVKNNV